MDIENLIEQLNRYFEGETLPRGTALDAATAISTLQAENAQLRADLEYEREHANAYHEECGQWEAENEKLRAELERVTAERDAAVKDLNEFLAMDELCPIQCEWCKWKDTFCDGKTPEWRGQKEDGNG